MSAIHTLTGSRNRRPSRYSWLRLTALGVLAPSAWAQEKPLSLDQQQQRERAQRQAQERTAQDQAPDSRLHTNTGASYRDRRLPHETPCTPLHQLRLVGERVESFAFVQAYLSRYAGHCVGQTGVALILRRAGDLLIERGFVTTRVGLPAQDLSAGVLFVRLIPGVIHAIRPADAASRHWHGALPMRAGDLLNLRDIEQALDQLRSLPSQQASIDIEAAGDAGQSDLIIKLSRSKPWHLTASLDDSGAQATGRYQAGLRLDLDHPLQRNDALSLAVTHDAMNAQARSSKGYNFNYVLPQGNWVFSVGAYGFRSQQSVPGSATTFLSEGHSSSLDVSALRLLHRSRYGKTSAEAHVGRRWAHSYIEHIELASQRRNISLLELALLHRHYFGNAQVDVRLAGRFGTPWFGAQWDHRKPPHDEPHFGYRLATLDLGLSLPFTLGGQPAQWSSQWHGQYSVQMLYGSEYLGIGGRYSVRGFTGDQTLAASGGWFWRNSFAMPLGQMPIALYAGIDSGQISGPGSAYLPAHSRLSGGFFGLRGNWRGLSWDAFVGKPLQGGRVLPNARPASGFQLAYSF